MLLNGPEQLHPTCPLSRTSFASAGNIFDRCSPVRRLVLCKKPAPGIMRYCRNFCREPLQSDDRHHLGMGKTEAAKLRHDLTLRHRNLACGRRYLLRLPRRAECRTPQMIPVVQSPTSQNTASLSMPRRMSDGEGGPARTSKSHFSPVRQLN